MIKERTPLSKRCHHAPAVRPEASGSLLIYNPSQHLTAMQSDPTLKIALRSIHFSPSPLLSHHHPCTGITEITLPPLCLPESTGHTAARVMQKTGACVNAFTHARCSVLRAARERPFSCPRCPHGAVCSRASTGHALPTPLPSRGLPCPEQSPPFCPPFPRADVGLALRCQHRLTSSQKPWPPD